jgi:hypothetical protein
MFQDGVRVATNTHGEIIIDTTSGHMQKAKVNFSFLERFWR